MNGLLDRGAEVHSTNGAVSRPSAAAGLAPPPTSARGSLRTPCPRRGRTTAPSHTAALALGRPRRRLLSLSALPPPLRLTAATCPRAGLDGAPLGG